MMDETTDMEDDVGPWLRLEKHEGGYTVQVLHSLEPVERQRLQEDGILVLPIRVVAQMPLTIIDIARLFRRTSLLLDLSVLLNLLLLAGMILLERSR